jgi:hypothetical protein
MPQYRLYFLQPDGSVGRTTDFDCGSDEEAIDQVSRIFYLYTLELRQGTRVVKRIERST